MKYYVYISDTKVDMLYEQIPQSIKSTIATEIKIDLKIFSTLFKDKEEASTKTRYSKLALVVDYIEKQLDVGSIDNPKAYIKGIMPMYWGPVRGLSYNYRKGTMEGGVILFFGGKSLRRTIGLSGSMKHLISSIDNADRPILPGSESFEILGFLDYHAKEKAREDSEFPNLDGVHWAINDIISRMENARFPLQRVEFLARTLAKERSPDKELFVLGSPIYVCLSDE